MNAKKFNASVIQAASVAFDREKCLEKVRALCADARKENPKIVVFPEAFVSAYPKGVNFGSYIGSRSKEGREAFREYWESAVDVPGPSVDFLGTIAKENKIYIVIGVIEREGGTLYCTVLFFGPSGDYLGKHRKLMPTASERIVWGFGDGSTLPVLDTDIGKLGAVICWENYMPLLRMAMYSKGVQIYCAPTADGRKTWTSSMQHVALEGRCFVLSCNQFSKRSDFSGNYAPVQGNSQDTIISHGGSCIVSPLGQILEGPVYDQECILTAEIDLDEIPRAKYDFDVVGHYARPDIFRLVINTESLKAVSNFEAGGDRKWDSES